MGYQKNVVLQKQFLWDFDVTNTAADSRAATGTIAIFSAPANCLIKSVKAHVITAVTGATSEIVGDGNDTNGYLEDGFAANTGFYPLYDQDPATTFIGAYMLDSTDGGTDALDVSIVHKDKFYSSADTIDFIIGGTATAGKIRFVVEFMAV
jgi:hypothetical protein